jgi:hypothetical protein
MREMKFYMTLKNAGNVKWQDKMQEKGTNVNCQEKQNT